MAAIGIDYTAAYEQGGGIGRYVRELVTALAAIDHQTDYRLFAAGSRRLKLPALPGQNFTWRPTRLTPTWLARMWYRAGLLLPVEFFTGAVDLYHATDFVLPPTRPKTRTIVTVHDLSFVRVPDAASPGLRAYLGKVVPQSVRRADHILADSQTTKDDLVELYSIHPDKVTVLLSGLEARFRRIDDASLLLTIRNKYAIGSSPYILSVGTVQPRKNYSRVVQALARLRARGYDLHFVIAGGRGWLEDSLYETIRSTRMQEYVHLIGFADDNDLPALYSAADIVTYPSLYEGFGFPILEGMACGTPVVTANVSSMPEVAGDAAILVDPYDVDALVNAYERIITDSRLRQTLIQRGFERTKQFSWETSARRLRQIYSDLLGLSQPAHML